MKKLILETKVKEINLDAEDWDLFTNSMNCAPIAVALNEEFRSAVNSGMNRDEVSDKMYDIQSKYSSYGASDTEPNYVVHKLLDAVFGK